MKKLAIITTLVAASFCATSALAEDNLALTVNGAITENVSTCVASMNIDALDTRNFYRDQFGAAGTSLEFGEPVMLSITDCSTTVKNSTITVSGAADTVLNDAFAIRKNAGDASGIAISIKNAIDGSPITPNNPFTVAVDSGQAQVPFTLSYISTKPSNELEGGLIHSVLNINVSYQ